MTPIPAKKATTAREDDPRRKNGTLESRGEWGDGKRVGPWKFWHSVGATLKAVGSYDQDGLFTGLWKWFGADGNLREWGRFENGEPHGLWKRWFGGRTQVCDVGRYEHGVRVGEWTFYDKNGKLRKTQDFEA